MIMTWMVQPECESYEDDDGNGDDDDDDKANNASRDDDDDDADDEEWQSFHRPSTSRSGLNIARHHSTK